MNARKQDGGLDVNQSSPLTGITSIASERLVLIKPIYVPCYSQTENYLRYPSFAVYGVGYECLEVAGRFDFEVRRYRQVYEKFGQSQFGVAAKTFCYPARGLLGLARSCDGGVQGAVDEMKQPKPVPKARPKPHEPINRSIREMLQQVGEQTHASGVLAVVSIIDYDLQRCIECKFRKINSALTHKLFRGYGPLSTFSARIDVDYVLDITSERINRELVKIKEIRNLLAHTKTILSLDKPPLKPLLKNLDIDPSDIDPDVRESNSSINRFLAHALAIDRYLEGFLVRMGVTEEIHGLKPSTFDF